MKPTSRKYSTLLVWILYAFIIPCFGQTKYEKQKAYLMEDAPLGLYQGIANDIFISIREIAHPCDSTRIRVFIPNGEVEHIKKSHYRVIINTTPSTATIYAETPDGLVKAGTMNFRGYKIPDTTDGNFRAEVVHIRYHVDKNENFNSADKNIPDHSTRYFLPEIWHAPVYDLYSDAPKQVGVRVIDWERDCLISPNVTLESGDAVITKIQGRRNVFSISPKPGIKKCKVNVFVNEKGSKTLVHTADLPVRKKPKDDY